MALPAILAFAQAGLSIAQGYSDSQDELMVGRYQAMQYDFNRRLAELSAADALRRGEKEASLVRARGRQVAGSQRVALAAQGIEIDSGSAADIQNDTRYAVERDILTTQNNAWREAWGYKVQAQNLGFQSVYAQLGAKNKSEDSKTAGLLGGLNYGTQGLKYLNK